MRAGARQARVRGAGERDAGEPGDGPRGAALQRRRALLPPRAHRQHRSPARALHGAARATFTLSNPHLSACVLLCAPAHTNQTIHMTHLL